MSLPVSAGDVIAVCLLIKDVVKALDDSIGSSAEYQEVIRELWSLDRALLEVELLSRVDNSTIELNALSQTTKRTAGYCRDCITAFLEKIKSYNRSLQNGGSGNKFKDTAKKIQWTLKQKGELARFRTEINGHSSAINMLLITASLNLAKITSKNLDNQLADAYRKSDASSSQQLTILGKIQERLEDNSRQLESQGTNTSRLADRMIYFFSLGAHLKSFMIRILSVNFKMYGALLDLQSRIPKEFGPCWIQEPLILTDPLGRVAPIHLELVNSWGVFESVLAARFIGLPGQDKIARREYAIQERGLHADIDRSLPFGNCFMPGRHIGMCMIFKQNHVDSCCPRCRLEANTTIDNEMQCVNCGMWFQKVEEIVDLSGAPDSTVSYGSVPLEEPLPLNTQELRRLKRIDTEVRVEDITPFQRVRLLHPQEYFSLTNRKLWPSPRATTFRRRDRLGRLIKRHADVDEEAGREEIGNLAKRKRLRSDASGSIESTRAPPSNTVSDLISDQLSDDIWEPDTNLLPDETWKLDIVTATYASTDEYNGWLFNTDPNNTESPPVSLSP